MGVLYILDEPSIGLHQRDNKKLIATLERMRDLGNTVIVVEHDEETIRRADHVIDLGPGAGVHGGQIVAQGTPREVAANPDSLTGQYLSGRFRIHVPEKRRKPNGKTLKVFGAAHNNLKDVDVEIPLGVFTCVTGVSGSGKSSLINETCTGGHPEAVRFGARTAGQYRASKASNISKVIDIDQSPDRPHAALEPATYGPVRADSRAVQQGARARRGYKPGRFSFNVKGGRCGKPARATASSRSKCTSCPTSMCRATNAGAIATTATPSDPLPRQKHRRRARHDRRGRCDFFRNIRPSTANSAPCLTSAWATSNWQREAFHDPVGRRSQRVKLATELSRRQTGRTLYILDEPTTGLHAVDVDKLLQVLHRLTDHGNTVVVIEHNLDVIKTADWIIDLGPEGGDKGGEVVAAGEPETVAACAASYTGLHLRDVLRARAR